MHCNAAAWLSLHIAFWLVIRVLYLRPPPALGLLHFSTGSLCKCLTGLPAFSLALCLPNHMWPPQGFLYNVNLVLLVPRKQPFEASRPFQDEKLEQSIQHLQDLAPVHLSRRIGRVLPTAQPWSSLPALPTVSRGALASSAFALAPLAWLTAPHTTEISSRLSFANYFPKTCWVTLDFKSWLASPFPHLTVWTSWIYELCCIFH